jgi:dipeptidyl aminopeptidase/acylaminoacyl peptidase
MPLPWLWIALAGTALLLLGARYLLHRGLAPEANTEGPTPADLGIHNAQTVRIAAGPGLSLFAWYLPAQAAEPATPTAPAVVLLHGWGGNASTLLPAALALHRAGYAVLLPESRNHGRSSRHGHSSLPRFAEDLEAALDWLATQPGIDPARLAALGHSVGAAAVLLVASRRPGLAAAVSVSSFAHPESIMRRWLAQYRVPYWPLGWLVNRYVESVIGVRFAQIAPQATLRQALCPVLLLHGEEDSTVPLADARLLIASKSQVRATLLVLPGIHEGFFEPELATQAVLVFLARVMVVANAASPVARSS